MRPLLRSALATAAVLAAWSALVALGTLRGWGRAPLAPPGDARAFFSAAAAEIDARNRGNAAFVLLEDGRVFGEYYVSLGAPVNRDTLFQVASLSKWVTAFGVLRLVERGELAIDAPVSSRLTRWRLPPSDFGNDEVTVRRLLSHTAGLTDDLGYGGFAPGQPVQSLEESLSRAADAAPHADGIVRVGQRPGAWRYSGGGYTLLQLLVEEVTGTDFATYMRTKVLEPLGMSRSTFAPADDAPNLATFYDVDGTPAPHYRFSALAAASLYTSAADLVRFLEAHLPGAAGEPPGRGVLEPETLERMREPHASRFGVDIWGLGTILYAPNGAGGFVIGHDGQNAPAINTTARLDPASGDGIVVLETGAPSLASDVGSEWVLWKTGRPDVLMLQSALRPALQVWLVGCAAIILAAVWLGRRRARPARALGIGLLLLCAAAFPPSA